MGGPQQTRAATDAARHRPDGDDSLGHGGGGIQEGVRRAGQVAAMSKWAPYLQSLARIIFGFLILRHGMEQALGYPEASDSALRSYQGVVELIAVPSAMLIMLGLFTRPVSSVLSALYFVAFFAGPLQRGLYTHRNGGDPILLNAFFFLYLSVAGGGAWSLDRLRNPQDDASSTAWTTHALSVLRIAA